MIFLLGVGSSCCRLTGPRVSTVRSSGAAAHPGLEETRHQYGLEAQMGLVHHTPRRAEVRGLRVSKSGGEDGEILWSPLAKARGSELGHSCSFSCLSTWKKRSRVTRACRTQAVVLFYPREEIRADGYRGFHTS